MTKKQTLMAARRARITAWVHEGRTALQIAQLEYGVMKPNDSQRQLVHWDLRVLGLTDVVAKTGPWELLRAAKAARRDAEIEARIEACGNEWGAPDSDGICEHLPCHWTGCSGCGHQGGRRVEVPRRRFRAEDFARTGRMEHARLSGLPGGSW